MEKCWTALNLTAAGRAVLLSEAQPPEIELMIEADVSIYWGDSKLLRKGTCTLTTHRVLWVAAGSPSVCLALHIVLKADAKAGVLGFSSPKIALHLQGGDVTKLSFHGNGRDAFLKHLETALAQKQWQAQSKTDVKAAFSTRSAGIGGLLKDRKKQNMQTDRAMQAAFTDLDQLMANAKDIVGLSQKISAAVARQRSEENAQLTQVQQKEHAEFSSMLRDMGIASPVTRTSAGAAYHVQLARQLVDFLVVPLSKRGGMMSLTDAYCVFNRARGTELASPEDVLRAVELFDDLGLPVELRKFDSGVLVVQTRGLHDEARLLALFAAQSTTGPWSGLSGIQVAEALGMSLTLAKQQLLQAEQHNLLCRDQSLEGLSFYPNLFLNF